MRCPFCNQTGTRPELHAHLTDTHDDKVITEQDSWGRRFMELNCPRCDEGHRQEVKPRYNDPQFLAEQYREIRLVAFDLFLYHWEEAHSEEMSDE